MHLNCLTQKCEDMLTDDGFQLTTGSSATDCHSVLRWAHIAQKYHLVVRKPALQSWPRHNTVVQVLTYFGVCRHYKCAVSISCATIFIKYWMTLCYRSVMPCHAMPCHAMPCHAMPCMSIHNPVITTSMSHYYLLYRISTGSHCYACCVRSRPWSACINRISLVHRPGALLGELCMLSTCSAFSTLAKTKSVDHIWVMQCCCCAQTAVVCYVEGYFQCLSANLHTHKNSSYLNCLGP